MVVVKLVKKLAKKIFRPIFLRCEVPLTYKKYAKADVEQNKIVFIEVIHPYITDSFELVYNQLVDSREYNIQVHFLENCSLSFFAYRRRVQKMIRDVATAKYVFIDAGSSAVSALPMREETKLIQLWHACGAFKKFGMSTAEMLFGENRKNLEKYPGYANQDLVSVSSPEVIWAYKEAMNIPEDSDIVKPLGVSRTDVFFDKNFISSAYDNLYNVFSQAKDKRIILYAPTYRGDVSSAQTPDKLDIKAFYEAFGNEYVLIIKHHPLVKKLPKIPEEFRDFALDCTSLIGINELLCVSDICISDYSSLVFEYSLFERPIIFFAYDLDNYFDWHGFYYSYEELAPGLIANTNEEIIDYIKNIESRFDKKAICDFKDKFMSACDGKSTKRIIDYVFNELK